MNEIERALKFLRQEKQFHRQMLKDLESEYIRDAQDDYAKGNSAGKVRCYDAIAACDYLTALCKRHIEADHHAKDL